MIQVEVPLKNNAYSIFLGSGASEFLPEVLRELKPSSVLVVTNITVAPLYLKQILLLASKVCPSEAVILPDGEKYKNWKSLSMILEKLAGFGADRKSVVVALGGGVVGDLAGFAASVYMRGIRFIQMPTTLLAAVDSSVGGKTGMNMEAGKNLIGAFHQPCAVLADTDFLKSLPPREISAGIGEIIKHGLLADKEYFEALETQMEKLLALESLTTTSLIAASCRIKAKVVGADEKEKGERAKLNFGHTFGHAIEKLAGYGTYLHGEAVGCGMVLAAEVSRKLGYLADSEVTRIRSLIRRANLPEQISGLKIDRALEAMKGDKKSTSGVSQFILLKGIGNAVTEPVSAELIAEVLEKEGFIR